MSLTPGARFGPYEIVSAIGAGGMGEVFRASDTKLNRDVAIKVLPAAFAHDPERLARFTREAQTLASLNHPNIAAIYGIEGIASAASSAGATIALVMELVEGEDLSAHIARWRPDGKELYYLNPRSEMMAAPISVSGSALSPGAPVMLFRTRILGGGTQSTPLGRQYDVAPDGRFLINTTIDAPATPITLLQNWNPDVRE